MAVKVTGEPAQILVALAAILIAGVTAPPVVVIVKLLEVAVVVVRQFALEVSITVTTSPLTSVDVVNDAAFVPALFPFTFHW